MITSSSNSRIKDMIKLKQKKYRDKERKYIVEGYHLVEEAYKKGVIDTIVYHGELPEMYKMCDTLEVSEDIIFKLSSVQTPQMILAICHMNQDTCLFKGKRYLLLDRIQDPGNAGTLVRSALAFGYDAVIFSKDSVDLYNDKYLRSTQGACFHLPTFKMDLKEAITLFQSHEGKVIGTALENAKSIEEYPKIDKIALVMGNEGQGMSEEIKPLCDGLAYIPISIAESLNVAIAGSIAMFYFK